MSLPIALQRVRTLKQVTGPRAEAGSPAPPPRSPHSGSALRAAPRCTATLASAGEDLLAGFPVNPSLPHTHARLPQRECHAQCSRRLQPPCPQRRPQGQRCPRHHSRRQRATRTRGTTGLLWPGIGGDADPRGRARGSPEGLPIPPPGAAPGGSAPQSRPPARTCPPRPAHRWEPREWAPAQPCPAPPP